MSNDVCCFIIIFIIIIAVVISVLYIKKKRNEPPPDIVVKYKRDRHGRVVSQNIYQTQKYDTQQSNPQQYNTQQSNPQQYNPQQYNTQQYTRNNDVYAQKGQYVDMDGYVRFVGSDVLVHRYIAERYILHRQLLPNEEVHHVNRNKLDNRSENLQVLDRGYHRELHRLGK